MAQPYRSTPVFDETTLPAKLRGEHRTKSGTWGVIRILQGALLLRFLDTSTQQTLTPETPGVIQPDRPHSVEPLGNMRMQIDFYDTPPDQP